MTDGNSDGTLVEAPGQHGKPEMRVLYVLNPSARRWYAAGTVKRANIIPDITREYEGRAIHRLSVLYRMSIVMTTPMPWMFVSEMLS